MAKQSIKTIRDKVVTLKLYRADTEEALTEDDMQKLAYDTPIMELTPMVTYALNHKKRQRLCNEKMSGRLTVMLRLH